MSFLVLLLIAMGKKINLSDRLILKESLNQNNFSSIVVLLKRIFKYTIFFEIIGALLLSIVFIPEFGLTKGLFYAVFHSISAFCNAGIDILGENSLINYSNNIILNITIMSLIIIGGLGFTVWTDISDAIKKRITQKNSFKKLIRELTLHTKIVIVTTLLLLITGTTLIFCFEFNNLTTMANNSAGEKLLKAAFQSTTLRTAGFSTINQKEMTSVSKVISACYMFVGGSPGSTAGGVKNVTMLVVFLLILSYMKDKDKVNIFGRNIPDNVIKRAVVVFAISIFIVIISTIGLLLTETFIEEELLSSNLASYYNFNFMDILFEVISAFGTVGLSLGITSTLSFAGKIIIISLMIIGRLRSSNYINCIIQEKQRKQKKFYKLSIRNIINRIKKGKTMKKNILVVGLKTLGMSIVKQLSKYNCEVLAIDKEMNRVEDAVAYATHAIQVDIRDVDELNNLSLNTFDIAIVTVDDIEASIMASLIFKEQGIGTVIVKATDSVHKRILEKMEVDKIISPEEEMGIKLAKSLMNASVIDAINFSDDYSILEINVLEKWIGKTLISLDLRNEYGMNVLCIKNHEKELNISPSQNCIIEKGDILVALVENEKIENTDLKY